MTHSALVGVFAYFWYQSVLCAAAFTAAMVSETGAEFNWQISYWLICFIGINIFSMIVY